MFNVADARLRNLVAYRDRLAACSIPMLPYIKRTLEDKLDLKFESKYDSLHARNYLPICRVQNVRHVVVASVC